ncbi:DUF4410 domain-containing protein [Pararobbsia alpina]|nr:DUF4410 domain-containing protein [Pararobbsia alpina]
MSLAATASHGAEGVPAPAVSPPVYVSDFDLDVSDVKPDSGRVQQARRLAGGLLPHGPLHSQEDPQAHAREIIEEMSEALTADLTKAGVDVHRLAPGASVPANGWQVRGVFLSVDEGNRMRRAVVGFGAGQGDLQVAVAIDDLSKAGRTPLYENVESETKDKPGAVIKLNPYVIAAKFVLSGRDEHAMIKNAAQQISDATVQRIRGNDAVQK